MSFEQRDVMGVEKFIEHIKTEIVRIFSSDHTFEDNEPAAQKLTRENKELMRTVHQTDDFRKMLQSTVQNIYKKNFSIVEFSEGDTKTINRWVERFLKKVGETLAE